MNYIEKIKGLFDLGDTGHDGFDEGALLQMENRLNISLPASFKAYYLTLGKNKKVNQGLFYKLIEPSGVVFFDDYLDFYF